MMKSFRALQNMKMGVKGSAIILLMLVSTVSVLYVYLAPHQAYQALLAVLVGVPSVLAMA